MSVLLVKVEAFLKHRQKIHCFFLMCDDMKKTAILLATKMNRFVKKQQKKFKKAGFSPKPLRTKSTLQHWTCWVFGMRGRCRSSCQSSPTACGRAQRNLLSIFINPHQLSYKALAPNPLFYQKISTCQPHFD